MRRESKRFLLRDLRVVVGEADRAERDRDGEREPHELVLEIRPEQRRNEDRREHKRDADDRRRLNLSLTLSGAALMKSLIACEAQANALGRAGLTEDEMTALLNLLRTVTANFENAKPSTAK